MGYDNYVELGYYRMSRNSYTKEDVEKFRSAVVKYLVPAAEQVVKAQAKRLGKEYPPELCRRRPLLPGRQRGAPGRPRRHPGPGRGILPRPVP